MKAIPKENSVIWTKISEGVETVISVVNSNGKYLGGTVKSPSLTITNTTISGDEAYYVCSATNSLGTGKSDQVFLDVLGGIIIFLIF